MGGTIDVCDGCGSPLDDGSHWAVGKTWCRACWSGRQPPKGIMPPTPEYKRQLALWCAPKGKVPPAQQTLRLGELAQPTRAP